MIDIILVTDDEISSLNRRWFKRNRATDVIAFYYGKDCRPIGEVYISTGAIKRQSRERGVSERNEFLRLMVHGTAHIEGHDDLTLKKFCRMREREWEMLIALI